MNKDKNLMNKKKFAEGKDQFMQTKHQKIMINNQKMRSVHKNPKLMPNRLQMLMTNTAKTNQKVRMNKNIKNQRI